MTQNPPAPSGCSAERSAAVDPKTIIDGDTFDISVRLLDIRRGHAHR